MHGAVPRCGVMLRQCERFIFGLATQDFDAFYRGNRSFFVAYASSWSRQIQL